VGHIKRKENERVPKKILMENSATKISRKTKNKMEGPCPQECITRAWNMRTQETIWGWKGMEVPLREAKAQKGL
jgi:hypothetical protein